MAGGKGVSKIRQNQVAGKVEEAKVGERRRKEEWNEKAATLKLGGNKLWVRVSFYFR